MRREEREALLKETPRAETPAERRRREAMLSDLEGSPVVGRPLPLRLRNFRPTADSYLSALGGPLPYMVRLREIADRTAAHTAALEGSWHELALECRDDEGAFARRWRETAARWSFDEVNDLIERHNRYYPAESRLAMDPVRRDFALVNGADYRRRPLDAAWVLERFPARLADALRAPSLTTA
jgi:hypothetical protein